MARLLNLFPREQVLVLKADELRRAPVAALAGRVEAGRGNDGGFLLDVVLPLNSQLFEQQRAETEQ